MDLLHEGGSIFRPPLLDGTNYSFWKACMRAFLKAIIEKVWTFVVYGWSPPVVTKRDVTSPKPISELSTNEYNLANWNSKGIHAIFNIVYENQYKVIANCTVANDAWDKLQIENEGTISMQKSRLRCFTIDFKTLIMPDDESISHFYFKICDITNESYA